MCMRRRVLPWLCGAVAMSAALLSPAAASAASQTCKGTVEHPGVLAGTHAGDVRIEGVCFVNAGPAKVEGSLTLWDGAVLVATFGLHDSSLSVKGNIRVERGATAFLGCEPGHSTCLDDPNPNSPTLSSADHIGGNLTETQPLGVIVHDSTIGGSVTEVGGGGGFNCTPSGVFTVFKSPVFSAVEDSTVGGSLVVRDLHSCWLGVARVRVGGSMRFIDNHFADPDAIEILSNHVGDDLACFGNSMVWDSVETSQTGATYPRAPQPNSVEGKRLGQCVLASPPTDSSPPGPGPF
jgi:hypothetical protein